MSILAVVGGTIVSRTLSKRPSPSDAPPVPAAVVASKHRALRCLVVGAGTIGSSFSSVYLAGEMEVVCMDPHVSRERLESRITECWPILVSRGLTRLKKPPFDKLTKTYSLEKKLLLLTDKSKAIDFVQACSWERVDHKQRLLKELDEAIDPSILIASSTSFILWPLLVCQCQHKHRIIMGHPGMPHILSSSAIALR